MPNPTDRFLNKRHAEDTRRRLGKFASSLHGQLATACAALQLARDYGLPSGGLQKEHDRIKNLWETVAEINRKLNDTISEMTD